MKLKMKLWLSSLLLVVSVQVSADAFWQEAAVDVEDSLTQMLAKIEPYKDGKSSDLEPLYAQLLTITNQRVDYPYLAKVVMGKYYRRANDAQKQQFLEVFKRTLVKTYGKILVGFNIKSHQLVEPRSASPKNDKQKVMVKVISDKGVSYTVINYMVKKEGQWKFVNIVLDGFNLRITFKNQFSKMMQSSKGDVSEAIALWSATMDKK